MKSTSSSLAGALLALACAAPSTAAAFSGGVSGKSGMTAGATCSGCHGGGATPTVAITGPGTLAPGATGVYTLTITSSLSGTGWDVATSAGTLADGAANVGQISGGEFVQSGTLAGGNASVMFSLTAPAVPGPVKLFAAGLAVDGDGGTGGDGTGLATLDVTVASPPDLAMAPPDLTVIPDLTPPPDLSGADLVGIDFTAPPPPDLAENPDLLPPPDLAVAPVVDMTAAATGDLSKRAMNEPRWACGCALGARRASRDALPALGLALALAAVLCRRR